MNIEQTFQQDNTQNHLEDGWVNRSLSETILLRWIELNLALDMALQNLSVYDLFLETRKKKPSGQKQERRKEKLPNHIRHDQNAAIAVGSWKHKGKAKQNSK